MLQHTEGSLGKTLGRNGWYCQDTRYCQVLTVTYVNKLCFKGHRGLGPPTKSQSFVLELSPSHKAGLGLGPGSLTVQFPVLSFG